MLFSNSAACFTLLALAQSFASVSAQSGGYQGTCKQCSTFHTAGNTYVLACLCGDGRGGYPDTSIDLGQCFGNSGGHLVFQHNGGFQGSCNPVNGPASGVPDLQAHCGDGHGGVNKQAHINTNSYIRNIGGRLTC
ncbi:hypothetical protein VTL71DRAFT_9963 [Oculimacula yallundae]|uniref:Cyanovirin-N domain-containing protein n=1 Tax=Oculimacula yallundae TaxID=86028 RepID=A0ABR4BSF5_9HELO